MNLTVLIIIITVIASIMAFRNQQLMENLLFWPYRMWRSNEWHRLLSGGFIHADGGHLLFNMIALFSFGAYVEQTFIIVFERKGPFMYLFMYFAAIALADIINLFLRKNDAYYRSLGASGGVAAVIFASILFNPFGKIYIFFIPIGIPSFVFGPIYLLYCVYMAKRGRDNIGHLAHFTGSVFGFIFPILFEPRLFPMFIKKLLAA